MQKFHVPNHWNDRFWLESRPDFLAAFQDTKEQAHIHIDECIWIDPQPLCDLFLQCISFALKGGNVVMHFNPDPEIDNARVLRWMVETGFFQSIHQ